MSFILDALKKSEAERQRQSLPGMVDTGIARPAPRLPLWAIAVALLLVVNLVVLTLLFWRRSEAPPSAADTHRNATARAPAPAQSTEERHFSPMDRAPTARAPAESAPPVYAPEITDEDARSQSTDDYADANAVRRAATAAANSLRDSGTGSGTARDVRPRDPVLTPDYKPEDEEVLPTMNEMNLTGAQALPELHLDVHVYATKPADRFVYVNMRKYHEKSTLQEGPTVEKIRRDGVVLSYQGVRFLLPRQ